MGGGLMQLVAYGAQDIYLTGNPQITFFKVVYRRHTNFSMECIKQSFKGAVGAGARVVATLARNGDLVHDCFLKFKANSGGFTVAPINPGHQVINNIECEIGGQLIDKHYGHWMETHAELTEGGGTYASGRGPTAATALNIGTARGPEQSLYQLMSGTGGVSYVANTDTSEPVLSQPNAKLFVPLRFWFCRHVGLSLPLIALQYHEVNINVTFSACYSKFFDDTSLWCNYIYLDTDERRRFAQVSHEYLIEQVQRQTFTLANTNNMNFKLNFNHPVKELIWAAETGAWGEGNGNADLTKYADDNTKILIKLNGHDRFESQDVGYFTRYQLYKYHPNAVTVNGKTDASDHISVYSFALKPEEHQPSGTCNFSRIDNAQLLISPAATSDTLNVYAVNYNVLRIMSGMGGLAYSN